MNPTVKVSRWVTWFAARVWCAPFRAELVRLGVNVTVRQTRGQEIAAACGQLAGSTPLRQQRGAPLEPLPG